MAEQSLTQEEHALSRWEATSLIVGAGVGAGIMAVPFLAERVGLLGLALILPIAWLASCLVHLMLAEVLFRTGRDMQIVELIGLYMMRGRVGRWLLWFVFALITFASLSSLTAYVSGAGQVIADPTGLDQHIAEFLIYAISAGVVLFGLRAVGIAERLGTLIVVGSVIAIAGGAVGLPFDPPIAISGTTTQWLALYGMIAYAMWTFYGVPQVIKGLGSDHRAAVRTIILGLAINGMLTLAVAVVALGVSPEVTQIAIVGIAERMGLWARIMGPILIVSALVTSYWSVSLALTDILRERTGIPSRVSWLIATLPSLLLLWLGGYQFLEWLQLAAGATGIIMALLTIPMYQQAKRMGQVKNPDWKLGRWGNPAMLALALLALIAMAVGSLISVG